MAKGTLTVRVIGDAKSFASTMDTVGNKVSGFGKTAAKVGMIAGAAGAAAAGGLFALAQSTANYGDEVAKGARATGLSTDAFQELGFALGQSGIEGEMFTKAMSALNKNVGVAIVDGVGPAADAMDRLGVSARDASGEIRSQDDIFSDLLRGLEGVGSAQERAAIASDLFGAKVGPKLASAIAEGGDGIDALRQKAHDLGIVMSEDAAHSAEAFNDRLDDLKQSVGGLARGAFEGLVPAFTAGFEGLTGLMQTFQEEGLGGVLSAIGDKVVEFAPVLGDALLGWAEAFAQWAVDAVPPMLAKAADLAAALVEWAVGTALPAVIDTLGGWAAAFAQWAVDAVPPLLEKLAQLLRTLGVWLLDTALPKIADKLGEWAQAFAEWVGPAIAELLPKLGDLLGEMAGWIITEGLPKLIVALGKWAWAFLDFIVTGVIPELPAVLAGLLEGILAFIAGALAPITEKLGEWASAFIGWVADLPAKITKAAAGLFDGFKDAFRGALNWIIERWNGLSFTLPSFEAFGKQIGGATLSVPRIPMLADGGIVSRPTLAMIGEAGPEAVIPLSRGKGAGMGGGPTTINVYMPVGSNGDDVVRALQQWARRNGPVPLTVTG